ncbi:MAG TPA: copper-binding protein [Rhodocyclaceae bacterium]|nr:copper-binding protein [Rhodocyclaceae bacterium]
MTFQSLLPAAIAASVLALAPLSVPAADHMHDHGKPAAAAAAPAPAQGEVKKVDKAGKTVTLAHGPLENLGMPAMTMQFKVKEAKWLDGLKPGDKVSFQAMMAGGDVVITSLDKRP